MKKASDQRCVRHKLTNLWRCSLNPPRSSPIQTPRVTYVKSANAPYFFLSNRQLQLKTTTTTNTNTATTTTTTTITTTTNNNNNNYYYYYLLQLCYRHPVAVVILRVYKT